MIDYWAAGLTPQRGDWISRQLQPWARRAVDSVTGTNRHWPLGRSPVAAPGVRTVGGDGSQSALP